MKNTSIKNFFRPLNDAKKIKLDSDLKNVIEVTLNVKENTASQDATEITSLDVSKANMSAEVLESVKLKKIQATILLNCKKAPALSKNIGVSWFEALQTEFSKAYFLKLSQFLVSERQQYKVFPPEESVYTWTQTCDIKDIKVVILGQDPYHNENQAHGLAFSVPKGVAIPPSLLNMYKELEEDIPGFVNPKHGNLIGWANQGVLLLNATLTVRAHCANSHQDKGWEQLTNFAINWININLSNVVFMLWGAFAQKKESFIDKRKHLVLKAPHPSPLSARRGFFGCKHFSKANSYLKDNGKSAIDWCALPSP